MTSVEIREALKREHIEYKEFFHEAVYTSLEGHSLALPHEEAEAKNLFLKGKKSYVLITVKSNKRVDLKAMGKALEVGSLSFGKEEDLRNILSLSPGAVTPMGLLNDKENRVLFFLDEDFKSSLIYVHPMENTSSILLSAESLLNFLTFYGSLCQWTKILQKEE